MSNEIVHGADSSKTLYALVYNFLDRSIYDVGDAAFEAIGTWDDARAVECAIAMTPVGDSHWADFPIVDKGVYFVLIKVQATGVPLASDKETGQGVIHWDGQKEINMLTEIHSWEKNC